MTVLYPGIAVWQAIALGQLLKQKRSLAEAGWGLWVLGFPVTNFARRFLLERLGTQQRQLKATVRALRRASFRQELAGYLEKAGITGERGLLSALGPTGTPTVIEMLAEFQLGTLPERKYTPDDFQIFQDGVVSAVSPDLIDDPDLPGPADVEARLKKHSREASLPKIAAALRKVEDSLLCVLRSEAQGLHAHFEKSLGVDPTLMSPGEFLSYFAQTRVDPEGRIERMNVIKLMGWKRPPITMVGELIEAQKRLTAERSGK